MKYTVLNHDPETGVAKIHFEHNDVVHEQEYNLKKVVPGSENTFKEMGIDFSEDYQLKVLPRLAATIEKQIDDGFITNPPPVEEPTASEEPDAPTE